MTQTFTPCKHFGSCGGCALQNMTYEQQLASKRGSLQTLLLPFWDKEIKVTPSPVITNFRNKVELGFCNQVLWKHPAGVKVKRDKTEPLEFEQAAGFKLKGRWDRAVEIQECLIFEPWLIPLLNAVRAWAKEENLPYYDQRKHTGVLRHLLLRQGKNTGQQLVMLLASTDVNTKTFVKAVESVLPGATILFATNTSMADTAAPDTITVLKGKGFIEEEMLLPATSAAAEISVKLKLSPQSFFQTNTAASSLMYSKVRGLAAALKPDTIYDLYGGAGSFSLACRDLCKKSVCVESVAPAIFDGQQNMKLNGAENILFFCDKVEDFLQKQKVSTHNSLIILDPPRSGLHPKAEKAVAASGVKNIFYISCNPVTLAENLKALTKNYNIKNLEAFDFFPHTNHVETLVELELK